MSEDRPVVLIVEDEPPLVEIYTRWLEPNYDVRAAETGAEALDRFGPDVDVVLLDRLMPGMNGDEVLSAIREQGEETAVAMVTAVEPDFDLIRLGVDAYLTKPVGRDELNGAIERLLDRRSMASLEREYFQLVAKRSALHASKDEATLGASEEFQELEAAIDEIRSELMAMGVANDAEFVSMVRDIADESGGRDV